MKYLIRFQYDGSKFYGFQRQNDKKTVQKELENALTIINKRSVAIKGAGRTDVGVHALGQCAHFELDADIPTDRLKTAINGIVEPYIFVFECCKVDDNFHARFMVKEKRYVYKIWLGEYDPFKYDYYLFYNKEINYDKLEECKNLFIGGHNFHNFVSGSRDNYDAVIYDIEIKNLPDEIDIVFRGKSFYRYMVRNLVGAMLDYNEGKCDIMLLEKMINDSNFNCQLRTAEAKGLYLEMINYGDEIL
jgi:tRNA pseudouridine38-40 synthase